MIWTDIAQARWYDRIDAANESYRALALATLGIAVVKPEISAQSLGKHAGGQGYVGSWNPKPHRSRRENLCRDVSCRSADRQDVGLVHRLHVHPQAGGVGGQQVRWYSKHPCKDLVF